MEGTRCAREKPYAEIPRVHECWSHLFQVNDSFPFEGL